MMHPLCLIKQKVQLTGAHKILAETFLGPTRLRTALYKSRNLVSVRLVRELGVSRIIDIADRFGLDTTKLPRNLSISLGNSLIDASRNGRNLRHLR